MRRDPNTDWRGRARHRPGEIVHAMQAFIDGLGVLVQCPIHGRVEQARLGGPRPMLRDGMDADPGVARLAQELP